MNNAAGLLSRAIAKAIDLGIVVSLCLMSIVYTFIASVLLLFHLYLVIPYLSGHSVTIHNHITIMSFLDNTADMLILSQFMIIVLYPVFFASKHGETIGKQMCRIKIVTISGNKPSFFRGLCRAAVEFVSIMFLGLGYIIAIFNSQKRTLHDLVCSTRVVRY